MLFMLQGLGLQDLLALSGSHRKSHRGTTEHEEEAAGGKGSTEHREEADGSSDRWGGHASCLSAASRVPVKAPVALAPT